MKKIILPLMITGMMMNTENPFILNPNTMRTEENSNMSVLDIYNINLFDEKTQKKQEKNMAEENSSIKNIEESLFKQNQLSFEKKLNNSIEEYMLFETDKSNEKKNIETQQDNILEKFIIILIVILINIIAALLRIKKWMKKLEKVNEEKI